VPLAGAVSFQPASVFEVDTVEDRVLLPAEIHIDVGVARHAVDEADPGLVGRDRLEIVIQDPEVPLLRTALVEQRHDSVVGAVVEVLPILRQRLGLRTPRGAELEVEQVVGNLPIGVAFL
jgi:hypothetical protein